MTDNMLSGVETIPVTKRILAAVFCGASSFLIIVVNKLVLTSYKFPSFAFLAASQMFTGLVVVYISKQCGLVQFPGLSKSTLSKIWPLPLFYIGNLIFGLGGTKMVSLPMFTVLRRFAILFTMIGEYFVLGVKAPCLVQVTVYLMIVGAIFAASTDLAFDILGYTYIILNNVATAANGVYTRKKLDTEDLGQFGILFYNALFMFIPILCYVTLTGEFVKGLAFPDWWSAWFLLYFLLSCFMGFVLNYSTLVCTAYNSALTTTVVGVIKNITVQYIGMVLGGDYVFSIPNFIGMNISVLASLLYSYVTFIKKPSQPSPPIEIIEPNISNTITIEKSSSPLDLIHT